MAKHIRVLSKSSPFEASLSKRMALKCLYILVFIFLFLGRVHKTNEDDVKTQIYDFMQQLPMQRSLNYTPYPMLLKSNIDYVLHYCVQNFYRTPPDTQRTERQGERGTWVAMGCYLLQDTPPILLSPPPPPPFPIFWESAYIFMRRQYFENQPIFCGSANNLWICLIFVAANICVYFQYSFVHLSMRQYFWHKLF